MADRELAVPTDRDFVARSLEENRFWLRIMKEHSLFLSEGFLRRDVRLIRSANAFFRDFDVLLQASRAALPSAAEVRRLNERSIALTTELRNFKQEVLLQILTGRIQGQFNLPLLVDHIRREAEYFITVLTRLNEGLAEPIEASIVRENVFWLRIMADHSRFIQHLLDPSERRLVQTASQFADNFDQLLAQARDLDSIIQGFSPVLVFVGGHTLNRAVLIRLQEADERQLELEAARPGLPEVTPPVLVRFNSEAQAAAREIRDFKRTALELVSQVRALSIINPLLADHVLREAEKFLQVLAMLESRISPREVARVEARVIARPSEAVPQEAALT